MRMPDLRTRRLREGVLDWYDRHGRTLAFRASADPWAVLVSEVMLQQTQAARVDPAWRSFIDRFPSPAALASASLGDALRAWAGLGYNRRAAQLHRAARSIVEAHGGSVPRDLDALRALPGVGPYTARAVAAIAFGAPVCGLDTNVRRVVGRVVFGHGHPTDPGHAPARRDLQDAADALVAPKHAADWTHALMDVGATACRPTLPACPTCPLTTWCAYAARRTAAGVERRPRARAATGPRFRSTRRWLRGRIIDRLRQAPEGSWVSIEGPLGDHDEERVVAAIAGLEHDGLLERHPQGGVRLPSTQP